MRAKSSELAIPAGIPKIDLVSEPFPAPAGSKAEWCPAEGPLLDGDRLSATSTWQRRRSLKTLKARSGRAIHTKKTGKCLKPGILQSQFPCEGGGVIFFNYFFFFFLLPLSSPKTTLYLRRGFYMFWFSSL